MLELCEAISLLGYAMGDRGLIEESRGRSLARPGDGGRRSRPKGGRGEADVLARWSRGASEAEPRARQGQGEAVVKSKAGEVVFEVYSSAKRRRVEAGMRRNRWRDECKRCRVEV